MGKLENSPIILIIPYHSTRLRINDKDGNLMMIVLPDLPEDLRRDLMTYLKAAFPQEVSSRTFKDWKTLKETLKFISYHFSWYARFAARVCFHLLRILDMRSVVYSLSLG